MIELNKLERSEYERLIWQALQNYEGAHNKPYFDSKRPNRHVTIGRGFDIEGDRKRRIEVFNVMRLGDNEALEINRDKKRTEALQAKELDYVSRINKIIKGPDTDNATLQKSLDKIMAERAADPDFQSFPFISSRKTFSITNPEIETVFTAIIKDKEDIISRKIASTDKLGLSRERAVLVALAYQGIISSRSAPLKDEIVNNDNRAEAWFQIRYKGHMGEKDGPGQSCRHYREADLFGLYINPDNISLDEAKQTYRMLQRHKDEINAYEKLHGPGGSVRNSRKRTGFEEANYNGAKGAKTIAESFAPAKEVLLAGIQEQYKDNPKLVAKLSDDIKNFRPIDNHLNALKEILKQPAKAHAEPQPVQLEKQPVKMAKESYQSESMPLPGVLKTGLMAHEADIEAARAEATALKWLGEKLGKTVDEAKDWLSEMLGAAKAGASELSPSKADNLQSFNRGNEQAGEYTNVRAKEIFGTLYETWQPCKEGYIDRQQEKKKLIYDMPTKTYEQTWNRLLDQRLTPEEQNAYEARKELQKKRDYLENYYLDFKARGEKKGYYRFYSQHLPEFMKSEGQKKHEMEKADLFRQHDELKGKEEANLAACESREAKQNDPEFKKAVDRTYTEMTTDKTARSERIKVLDGDMGILKQRLIEMSKLSKYLPESIGNREILIKGDPKDIDNVLAQSREIRAQTAHAVLEKQPDYNFETGRPHEAQNEYRQQIQRTM
jgi:hypothetical protein